jgi:TrmH family RNA methyltransferase
MPASPLTSPQNPLIKEIRKAAARGGLTARGLAIAETYHLVEEALRSGLRVEAVLCAASAAETVDGRLRGLRAVRVTIVEDRLFHEIAATETSQGVMALVTPPSWKMADLLGENALVVVLDGVQDPGNAGTIVRTAEAFGASGVVFLKGSVHPYHPKTLRASAGSLFRVPVVSGIDADEALAAFEGLDLYAAMPRAELTPGEADLRRRCGFIIGSEGRGVGGAIASHVKGLRIPTTGVESLNAAMAAGILLYETRRQRILGAGSLDV